MTQKKCCTCGKLKDSAQFYRDRTTQDGRAYRCRDCRAEFRKEDRRRKRVDELIELSRVRRLEIERQNLTRRVNGLPELRVRVHICLCCGVRFESTGDRRCPTCTTTGRTCNV